LPRPTPCKARASCPATTAPSRAAARGTTDPSRPAAADSASARRSCSCPLHRRPSRRLRSWIASVEPTAHARSTAGQAGGSAPVSPPSSLRLMPAPPPAKPAAPLLGRLRRAYGSCRDLELGDLDVVDAGDRQLQEATTLLAERVGLAGRQEPVRPLPRAVVLDALARQRLGDLARGLVRGEDEAHVTPERALEHRLDQRVVRAAEDH